MKKTLYSLLFLVILSSCVGGSKSPLDKITAVELGTSTNQALSRFKKQGFKPLNLSIEESLERLASQHYSNMFQKNPDLFVIHAFRANLGSATPSDIFALFYADQLYTLYIIQNPIDMKAYDTLLNNAIQKFGEAEFGTPENVSVWYLDNSDNRVFGMLIQDEDAIIILADESIPEAVEQALFDALPNTNSWPFVAAVGASVNEVMMLEGRAPFERFFISEQDELIGFLANFNGDRLIYSYIFFANEENESIARMLMIHNFEGDLDALEAMLTKQLGTPLKVSRKVMDDNVPNVSSTLTEWSMSNGHVAKMFTMSYPAPHFHLPGEAHSDEEEVKMLHQTYFGLSDDSTKLEEIFNF